MNRLTPTRISNLLKMYGPNIFKKPPRELVELRSSPRRASPQQLGKRKRVNGQNLSRKGRVFRVGNSKRRKIHVRLRYTCNETSAINRLRTIIGNSVHKLFINTTEGVIRGETSKSKRSYYLITIIKYLGGTQHANHAVSAIRTGGRRISKRVKIRGKKMSKIIHETIGGTLYVFDPWGNERLQITNTTGQMLGLKLKVDRVVFYNGENLQARNTQGVCVGMASDFLVKVHEDTLRLNKSSFNTNVTASFRKNANNPANMFERLTRYNNPTPVPTISRGN